MTFNENDEATLAYESGEESAQETDTGDCGDECGEHLPLEDDGRAEYERLIREKYKEYFAADTQRLINKRFKKYKEIEAKVKRLEEDAARYSDIDKLLADERERAIRETEERMNRSFKARRSRAEENAVISSGTRSRFDVTRLTKDERALLAKRAQKGEKIHF